MNRKVSRRYSTALYETAKEAGVKDQVMQDAESLLKLLKENRDLELFFKNPVISKKRKSETINVLFKDKVSGLMLDFLLLINSRNRENIVEDILTDLIDYRNEKEGLVNVNIKTAIDLDKDERGKLLERIDLYTKKKSIPVFETDKSIIGGFVVKIHDTIIDSSIKNQLELLRKKFREGDVILN